jgi:cyclomaltodextrinase
VHRTGEREAEAGGPGTKSASHGLDTRSPGLVPSGPMSVDTPAWARDAIFYQIFPDRFAASERVQKPGVLEPWDAPPTVNGFKGGDLRGIAEHLDYLQDLGINAIYMTPIFSSASNHRYHTYDYFEVDPLLGGNDALRELLDAAHGRGMRVVLDGVFNHTGRGFWPFHHVLENGPASPYRGWFHLDDARLDAGRPLLAYPPPGTATSELGYKAWWGLPALPKLNTANPEVREFLFTVAEFWLRFGIDGWRLDVPEEIEDGAFWQEFRGRCRAIRPDAYLVGEIWRIAPEWLEGDRFDALMNYPLAEAILGFAGGSHLDMGVVNSLRQYRDWLRPLDGPAFASRLMELANAYDPDVVAVQLNLLGSHDAPRVRTVLGGDIASVRLATLIQATLPGAPCIYYGDEIGLAGGTDPDCRGAFPWDESRWDHGLRDSTRAILHMRAAEPALRDGPLRVVGAEGSGVAYQRGSGSGAFVVAVNPGDAPVRLHLRFDDGTGGGGRLDPVELPGTGGVASAAIEDGVAVIDIAARSGAVLRLG